METRPTRTGGSWWSQRVRSFACAGRGLWWLVTSEPHARIHAVATVLVVAAGFWFSLTRWEWCAVLGASGLVWTAEGFNTALEALADRVAPDFHPLVGRAKDVAAGAVLAASIFAVVIGVIVFGPRLISG